jgi:hypothetical protein
MRPCAEGFGFQGVDATRRGGVPPRQPEQAKTPRSIGRNQGAPRAGKGAGVWKPNQLLTGRVAEALRLAGFSESKIEFLGWLSYTAKALNNSFNPTKAAHTLLAKPKIAKMVPVFVARKKESLFPKAPAEHEAVDAEFGELDKWAERRQQEAGKKPQGDEEDE